MLQIVEVIPSSTRAICPELAIIIPTFNERANIKPLLEQLDRALAGVRWEVVFVDDNSPDGTSDLLLTQCQSDPRVRSLRRVGRRGLSSAVVEGILSTSTPYVAVMDADMQHDERLLPKMLAALKSDEADLAVGSRYVANGSVGSWDEKRQRVSHVATVLSRLVLKADLADPMSGFFMLRRLAFDGALSRLSIQGFKILLDIIASSPAKLRVKEIPYDFRPRQHGDSKLDALVSLEYLTLLIDKLVGKWVPVEFVLFSAVGALGVLVHMSILAATHFAGVPFVVGQTASAMTAMTGNFFLNNALTYRDMRLKGLLPVLRGLLSFYAICSIGALANVGVASFLFTQSYSWWLSGLSGVLMSAVWNYGVSRIFTWRK
jgi:dolichol-phosphate mannosyltransferase